VRGKGASLEIGDVRRVFGPLGSIYDVSADGERFLTAVPPEWARPFPDPLIAIMKWAAGLRK
jgi:hypothetical protein